MGHYDNCRDDHIPEVGKMVLVPREPTPEMIEAHYRSHAEADAVFADAQAVWAAMLSAAPQPSMAGEVETRILDLIGRYWDLAWSEGRRGVSADTKGGATQGVLSFITAEVRALSADNARLREERESLEKSWQATIANPWCPDVCPITGRRLFMWIDGEPTYGGPFDSYTIPTRDADGEFSCRRYDHDEGGWKDWDEGLAIKLIDESDFITLEERAETAEARLSEAVEVLKPFADFIQHRDEHDPDMPDDARILAFAASMREEAKEVTFGQFRAARQFLDSQGGGNG